MLSVTNLPEVGEKLSGEYQDIYTPNAKFDYYNIYAPKFSPDGKHIVFSYFDNETRGLAVIDRDGKTYAICPKKVLI